MPLHGLGHRAQRAQFLLHGADLCFQPPDLLGPLQENVQARGDRKNGQPRHHGQFPAQLELGLQNERDGKRHEQRSDQDGDIEHGSDARTALAALDAALDTFLMLRSIVAGTVIEGRVGCGHVGRQDWCTLG